MSSAKSLHDRLGSMIDQVGQPDYSLRELVAGLREVRDDLLAIARSERTVMPESEVWQCYLRAKNGFDRALYALFQIKRLSDAGPTTQAFARDHHQTGCAIYDALPDAPSSDDKNQAPQGLDLAPQAGKSLLPPSRSTNTRNYPICKDHTHTDWNQPFLEDDNCILCRLFYLEAQEGLLEEWQQRAKKAEASVEEVQRPLDAQMARLNARVIELNAENERLRSSTAQLEITEEMVAAGASKLVQAVEAHLIEKPRLLADEPWRGLARAILEAALPRSATSVLPPADPEHDALVKDAARYRAMRASAAFQDRDGPGLYWYLPRINRDLPIGDRLDAALDAAMHRTAPDSIVREKP